jgi:hypothetical protein
VTVAFTKNASLAYKEASGIWPHQALGLRQVYKGRGRNRQHLTGLYDGEGVFDTEGGRWQTVCERHHHIISHDTLATARSWLTHPEEWCDGCIAREAGLATWVAIPYDGSQ